MAKILMGSDNPHGWKLEDLLATIAAEVGLKCLKIKDDASPVARAVLRNNQQIMGLLGQAEALQRASQDALDILGPNQGPEGKPRIGVGSGQADLLGGGHERSAARGHEHPQPD